jgi:hypothetical protein
VLADARAPRCAEHAWARGGDGWWRPRLHTLRFLRSSHCWRGLSCVVSLRLSSLPPLSVASLCVACLCVRWLFGWSRAPLACSLLPPTPLLLARLPLSRFLFKSLLFALSPILLVRDANWLRVSSLVHWLLMHVRSVAEWVVTRVMSLLMHEYFPPALPPHSWHGMAEVWHTSARLA